MGRNHAINTWKSVTWKIRHGYGRGEGLNYKPWLTGHEFPSRGRYIRLIGRTVPRLYCFMSGLEADAFVIYDNMPDVSDILEQYYDTLEETLEIADLLHVRHPYSGKYYNPVTTDLLIRKGDTWIARAVKTTRDLEKPRTIEKLEIEREYFNRRNIDWKIITEKELNRDLVQNLNWLWYGESPGAVFPNPHLLSEAESLFYQCYSEDSLPFPMLLDRIESIFCLPPGSAICVFKSLLRKGLIQIDLTKPINMLNPRCPIERRIPDERYRSYC